MLDFLRAPIARLASALLGLTGGATAASASSVPTERTLDYKLELLTPMCRQGPRTLSCGSSTVPASRCQAP